ncbi:hypothetical protein OPT61_g8175 [Boeremia exigua]|uniref:Uncharacterized protein n=1 Tax=Boeremia exigua TaxID=749465 RepID=A0ACC2HZA3_9PLEO|nr:hypothetical protein OPT61_g8175 [Boeremia exigua]
MYGIALQSSRHGKPIIILLLWSTVGLKGLAAACNASARFQGLLTTFGRRCTASPIRINVPSRTSPQYRGRLNRSTAFAKFGKSTQGDIAHKATPHGSAAAPTLEGRDKICITKENLVGPS